MISIFKKQPTLRTLIIYSAVLLMLPVEVHNVHHPNDVSQIHKLRHQSLSHAGRNNDAVLAVNTGKSPSQNYDSYDENNNIPSEVVVNNNDEESEQYNETMLEKFNMLEISDFEPTEDFTINPLSLVEDKTFKLKEADSKRNEKFSEGIDSNEVIRELQRAVLRVLDLKIEHRPRSMSPVPLKIIEQYNEYLIENQRVQQSLKQNCDENDCILKDTDNGENDALTSRPGELLLSEENSLSTFTNSIFDQGVTIEYDQPTTETTVNKSQSVDDTMIVRHKRDSDEHLIQNNRSKLQLIPLWSGDFNRHKRLNEAFKNNKTIKGLPQDMYLSNFFDVVHHRNRRGVKKRYNKSCYKKITRLLETPLTEFYQRSIDWQNADLNIVVNEWIGRFQSLCHGQLDIHVTQRKGYPIVSLRIFRVEITLSTSDNAVEMNGINQIDPTERITSYVLHETNADGVEGELDNIPTLSSQQTLNILSEIAMITSPTRSSIQSEFEQLQDPINNVLTLPETSYKSIQDFSHIVLSRNNFVGYNNVINTQLESGTNSVAPPPLPVTDLNHKKANQGRTTEPGLTKSKHRRATTGWSSQKSIPAKVESSKGNNYCRRRPLYIDFEKIGLDDWILEPPGYNAYYCAGDCPMVLPDHFNATNHAIIQSLLHSVNKKAIPSPCCVAIALSPIPMIYLGSDDHPVVGNYKDMVVEACGCR